MTDFDKYYEATEPGYRERAIGWATAIGLQDVKNRFLRIGQEYGSKKAEVIGGLHRRDVVINRDEVVINVVIKLIRGNSRISAAGIAKEVGLSARQVQRLLAGLKKSAGLKRRGSRKTGEWYFES